jgi:PAS domain S-box-containing protein/putative nucleotidyltransferase with HDIG domain
MNTPLSLLILEDRPSDAELMLAELRLAGFEPDWKRVDNEADYLAALDPSLDLILADYHLPQFDGRRALQLLNKSGLDIPFILVSGEVGEETAVEMMKQGAADYVLKDRMKRLGQAVVHTLEDKRLQLEKKRAEAARQESERRLNIILESDPTGIMLVEKGTRKIAYLNHSASQMVGLPVQEILGKVCHRFICPTEERACPVCDLGQRVDRSTRILMQPDGNKIPILKTVTEIQVEGKEFLLESFVDITEQKQAEEALQAAATEWQTTFDATTDGIYMLDRDQRVIRLNKTMAEMLKIRPEDAIGKPCWEVLHGRDGPIADCPALRAKRSGHRETLEYGVGKRWLEFVVDPIYADNGKLTGHVHIVRDITERKQAEEALSQRAEEFASLYEMAHDLAGKQELSVLLQAVVGRACNLLHAQYGGMYLYDPVRQELENVVATDADIPTKVRMRLGEGLAGRIAQNREPLVVDNYQTWEGRSRQYEGIPISATVGVPMEQGGELVGVLLVHEGEGSKHTYSEEDVRLLSMFAGQAASAVYNARLLAETHRRLTELEAVNRISSALRVAQTTGEMLPILMDETLKLMHCEAGVLWLFDPASGTLQMKAPRGWFTSIYEEPLKPGEGIAGSVFASGEAILSEEFASDPRVREKLRNQIPTGWGGACVPIRTEKDVIGALFVAAPTPRQFQPEEISLLTTISEMTGTAIRRAGLHDQTEKQVQRLSALRTIDHAINSSLNLRLTLDILLAQIHDQLGVDAAAVLLFNRSIMGLEYAAGRGFRTQLIERSQTRLGEGNAGRSALEKRTLVQCGLQKAGNLLLEFQQMINAEGFDTQIALPLVAKGEVKGVLEIFQRAPLTLDADRMGFLETLAGQAALAINNSQMFEELQHSNLSLSVAYDATIEGWSKALDLRDEETEGHSERVTSMVEELARLMQVDAAALVQLRRGALLHDIGKMGVPDEILRKPGPLTDEEWVVMRKHPQLAHEMLAPISYLLPALDIPYCHHEKWDGSGYPRGLKGQEIPLAARLFAVVDVYDALTSDRPYRKAWSKAKALDYIREQAGKHFDPKVVEVFFLMQK